MVGCWLGPCLVASSVPAATPVTVVTYRAAQLDQRQLLVLENRGLEALANSRRISHDSFSQQFRWLLFATQRKATVPSAPEE